MDIKWKCYKQIMDGKRGRLMTEMHGGLMEDQRRSILHSLGCVVGGGWEVVFIAENQGRLPGEDMLQMSPKG